MNEALTTWVLLPAFWVVTVVFLAWQSDKRGIGFLFLFIAALWTAEKLFT